MTQLGDLFVDDWELIRQSLPQHHVSSERDYAPGHPALDALTRLQEQLEAVERERDEWREAYRKEVGLDVYNRQATKRASSPARNPDE